MGDMGFALQLSVIALGALILISLLFVGLSAGLARLARIGVKEEPPEVAAEKERRKRALIAAAVMSYLEAERLRAGGKGGTAAELESTEQEGEK